MLLKIFLNNKKYHLHLLHRCKSLEMIFSQALASGSFPSEWKKGNIVPSHKKNDKQNLINYRLVSQLPICGIISERLIFDRVRLNYATTHHYSPPATTSQNISTIQFNSVFIYSRNINLKFTKMKK